MPPYDPTSLDDEDDLFGDVRPTEVPARYSASAGRASTSGSIRQTFLPSVAGTADTARNVPVVEEMDWEEENRQDPLIVELIRTWTNERLAPDILDQRGELIQKILDRIREQAELVLQLRSDPDAIEDEHFQIILVQTEVERIRFIVRSYMRTRIHKIEKFAHYILGDLEVQARLSAMELKHVQSYAALVDSQFDISVLNALPVWVRREGPSWQGPSTISKPNKDASLFVHALQDCPHILLPDGRSTDILKGSVVLIRYSSIENNLRRGEVELV